MFSHDIKFNIKIEFLHHENNSITTISSCIISSYLKESCVAGDDVVAYKHGENSARTLSSVGFQNLMFRSYGG